MHVLIEVFPAEMAILAFLILLFVIIILSRNEIKQAASRSLETDCASDRQSLAEVIEQEKQRAAQEAAAEDEAARENDLLK